MLGRRSRIEVKTPEQLRTMRAAGLVVADALAEVRALVAPGITTGELDAAAARVIEGAGATSNFKGYHGFPGVICTSVNDEVVHGIPGGRVLHEGDLISIDCGAIVDGWHGDSAITVPVGHVSPAALALSEATERALWAGIAKARVGGRLTDIGAACEAEIAGRYGIVVDYVGHGIGSQMHMAPDVLNYRASGGSPALKPGMCLAIEPMLVTGGIATSTLSDDWTVVTDDGGRASQWEHSVAIHRGGLWVLTAEDGGASELEPLGVTPVPIPGS